MGISPALICKASLNCSQVAFCYVHIQAVLYHFTNRSSSIVCPVAKNIIHLYIGNDYFSKFQMVWKRLNDHGKNWRHVYKALVLLEYLIKTGSEKVIMYLQNLKTSNFSNRRFHFSN